DADCEPVAQRREELVAGPRGLDCGPDGRSRGAAAQAHRPGEREDGGAAGQLLEGACVAPAYVAHERRTREREEADLSGATRGPGGAAPPAEAGGGARAPVDPERAEVVAAARASRLELGDGREVHVVLDVHGGPRGVAEPVEQAGVVPAG